jgi:hypothetical protein
MTTYPGFSVFLSIVEKQKPGNVYITVTVNHPDLILRLDLYQF